MESKEIPFITAIGSRELKHKDVEGELRILGREIIERNYGISTGGAAGSDSNFGWYIESLLFDKNTIPKDKVPYRCFIPEDGFCFLSEDKDKGIYVGTNFKLFRLAASIAACIHPAWDRCKPFVRLLHIRNVFQVMGSDLLTPAVALFAYAPPLGDSVKGGTSTAWNLAKALGISCYNFYGENGEFNMELKNTLLTKDNINYKPRDVSVASFITDIVNDYGVLDKTFLREFHRVYL